jgi:hypothetical protein
MKWRIPLAVLLLVPCGIISAHELTTHGLITREAYSYSRLGSNTQIIDDLGLADRTNDLGTAYYDWQSATDTLKRRSADGDYEGPIISDTLRVLPLSIQGWLIRGAIREDDFYWTPPGDVDPYDIGIARPLNHFFDPYFSRALTVGTSLGDTAVNWGLGVTNAFSTPVAENIFRSNHFSLFDAREAMWRAVTGKEKDGKTDAGPNDAPVTEVDRKAYWATTFRALGDILHLNQDMSQPQHTRNEPHSGRGPVWVQNDFTGHTSFFEKYLNDLATGSPEVKMDGSPAPSLINVTALARGQYPIPTFAKYGDFWSTTPGPASLVGQGLADYSNQGFFTMAHNMDNAEYPSPPHDPSAYVQDSEAASVAGHILMLNAYKGTVADHYTGNSSDLIHMTTQSIWSGVGGAAAVYTLDRREYDDMATLLLPRAVAYSAGLINYFFRGRLSIAPPDEGVYGIVDHAVTNQRGQGFKTIKLKIQNITQNGEAMGNGSSQGVLVAVVKYHLNKCYQTDLSDGLDLQADPSCYDTTENITTSAPITVTSIDAFKYVEYTFDFSQKPVPIDALDLSLQVVYRGKLGNEDDAVVAATRKISGPTFFSFYNDTDQFCYQGNWIPSTSDQLKTLLDFDHDNKPDMNYVSRPLDVLFWFTSSSMKGTVSALPAGSYARVAVLADMPTIASFITEAYTSPNINPPVPYFWAGEYSNLESSEFELDTTTKSWLSTAQLGKVRNTNYFNAMEFFNYYPDQSCDTSALPAVTNLKPVQVGKLPF